MCNNSNYNNINPSRMFMFGIFGRLGYSYFKICQIHYSFHSLPFSILFSFKSHCRNPFLGPGSRSHHDHKTFHHNQDLNCGISLSAYHFLLFQFSLSYPQGDCLFSFGVAGEKKCHTIMWMYVSTYTWVSKFLCPSTLTQHSPTPLSPVSPNVFLLPQLLHHSISNG